MRATIAPLGLAVYCGIDTRGLRPRLLTAAPSGLGPQWRSNIGVAPDSAIFCMTALALWIHNAAEEEDRTGAVVADVEEERMVGAEDGRRRGRGRRCERVVSCGCRCGGRFGSLLVDVDECLVQGY